jgi:hypothetical protein
MHNNNNSLVTSLLFALATIIYIYPANFAYANIDTTLQALNLIKSNCPATVESYPELSQIKTQIVHADSLQHAQAMALAPTELALSALLDANNLLPFNNDLQSAIDHLNEVRIRIQSAANQEQVADEFAGMMLAGLDDDKAAQIKVGKTGCDYSSGEIIAIVIGLILGIIPGLILLVVLC